MSAPFVSAKIPIPDDTALIMTRAEAIRAATALLRVRSWAGRGLLIARDGSQVHREQHAGLW
jgi:hypothetical protein